MMTTSIQRGNAHSLHAAAGHGRWRRLWSTATLLVALTLGLSLSATAQQAPQQKEPPSGQATGPRDYALIFGTVYTAQNFSAPGVKVCIAPAAGLKPGKKRKCKWEHMSDSRGEFAQRVPRGKADYLVWVEGKVPKGREPKDLYPEAAVSIENDERADISLHLKQ